MSCTLENKKNNDEEISQQGEQATPTRNTTAREMLREISEILKIRQRESSSDRRDNIPETPFYFLVCADKSLVESSGEKFLPESAKLGFAVLYAYGDIRTLPKECNAIIDCGDWEKVLRSSIQKTFEYETGKIFIPDGVNITLNIVDKFARSLAPVRVQTSGNSGQPPSKALLFEGLGVKRVEDLQILEKWKVNKRKSIGSLSVPIGIKGNNDVFNFDIHPNITISPHGVVAGTSGSGKSEMLTAWLLSLAMHYSPEDLNILIIEFKGNDLSNILTTLPHIAGVVNNLQGAHVIERSLASLTAENDRRQKIFESLRDLDTKSLPAYKKYRDGHPEENLPCLPYLIVVLDEFAEFKKQFPDQIDRFVKISTVGRSVGMYMVIATQSPSGVVPTQMEANISYHVCLRTANTGESKELLGTTDAFFISRAGRAYIKIRDEIYEQVQTFFSKVPYEPDKDNKESVVEINIVEIDGKRRALNENKKIGETDNSNKIKTEGQVLVSHIVEVAKINNFAKAKPVWTQLLPPYIDKDDPKKLRYLYLSDLSFNKAFQDNIWKKSNDGLAVTVGLLDNPSAQSQYPFVLDFVADGHQILFGAPMSGKTTFLQTAILSAALSYTPEQLQFLIFDFGSGSMRTFEDLPHTLMVVNNKKEDKLHEAEEFLLNELDRRNNLFESQRVSTIAAYRKVSGKNLPFIIVAIDNIMVIKNQFSDMMDSIVKIASEGGSLGIYILSTCSGSSIFKLDDYMKSKHALELTDISEYRTLVGAASKQAPEKLKGRGFTQGPLEFQTALCVEGETAADIVMNLRNICLAMREAWSGNNASLEEEKNREIDVNELEFTSEGFQIGIDKNSKQPVEFIYSEMPTCIISGISEESRINVLSLIINAFSNELDTKIYLYEPEEKIGVLYPNCISVHEVIETDNLISELADEFDRRLNDDEENYSKIVFCVDNFLKFYRMISQESADILESITRSGADCNIYFYIASNIEDIAFLETFRASIKSFDNCMKKGNAMAMGGNIRDYAGFGYLCGENDIKFADNEGCLIHNNQVTVLKFAKAGANSDE